jgi:hypothetical protein
MDENSTYDPQHALPIAARQKGDVAVVVAAARTSHQRIGIAHSKEQEMKAQEEKR